MPLSSGFARHLMVPGVRFRRMPKRGAALAGVRVAVTRPLPQAGDLASRLHDAGAAVLIAPLIRIVPPRDAGPLRAAIRELAAFDWIVFSSVNGVSRFMAALAEAGVNADRARRVPVACVGPATADAARSHGLHVAAVPHEFIGAAIADALMAQTDLRGKRVLLARAGGAGAVLPQRLHNAGALVTDVEVYRSASDSSGAGLLRQHIAQDALDAITLTSGSAVRYFVNSVGAGGQAVFAVIGPVCAHIARNHGLAVAVEAEPHTAEGLVAGLVDYFTANREPRGNG